MKKHKHPYIPNYIQHPHKLCLEIPLHYTMQGPIVVIRSVVLEDYESLDDFNDQELEDIECIEETIILPKKWMPLKTPSRN